MTDQQPPTLRDVATTAGVSPATASRALNPAFPKVRPEVRQRVHNAAQRLGYQPLRRRPPRQPTPVLDRPGGHVALRRSHLDYDLPRALLSTLDTATAEVRRRNTNARYRGELADWAVYAITPVPVPDRATETERRD